MLIKYFNRGFNFSQDGPGNRLVYHLQGCNLKCPWCANPEGIAIDGSLMTYGNADGKFCKNNAVTDGYPDRSVCKNCDKTCTEIPASGIKLSCKTQTVDEAVDYISNCRPMFFSGGGVTFTGGEPSIQFDALKSLLEKLKAKGINTAVESNATHPRFCELFGLIDYLIFDCKHYNSEKHKEICGLPLSVITQNIKSASHLREQLLVRIPLIGGFNASRSDAEGFAKLFTQICTDSCSFEFLRYHEFGKDKYKKCGLPYTMGKEAYVEPETVKYFENIFEKHSLKTIHT